MGRAHRAPPFRRHGHQGMVHAEQGVGIEPVQVDGALPRRRARQVPLQVQQVSTFIWLHTVFFKLRLEIGELVASASRQFEHGLRFRFCFYDLDNREHVDVGGHSIVFVSRVFGFSPCVFRVLDEAVVFWRFAKSLGLCMCRRRCDLLSDLEATFRSWFIADGVSAVLELRCWD